MTNKKSGNRDYLSFSTPMVRTPKRMAEDDPTPRKRQRTSARSSHTADQANLIERVEAAEARYSTQISQNPTQLRRHPGSLRSLCARVICDNIRTIGSPANTHFFRFSLLLPDILSELAHGLRSKDASDMTIDLVSVVFLNPDLPHIALDDCRWVSNTTLARFTQLAANGQGYANLRHLSLNNQINLSDATVARIMPHLRRVERLELRGCVKVGDKTMEAVANHCARTLRYLNVGMTGTTLAGLGCVIRYCRELETFKVAEIERYKDKMWIAMLEQAVEEVSGASSLTGRSSGMAASTEAQGSKKQAGGRRRRRDGLVQDSISQISPPPPPLSKLKNLKLRGTNIGNAGLEAFLRLCGQTLERLDISRTKVTRLQPIINHCIIILPAPSETVVVRSNLEKLNISLVFFHLQDLEILLNHLSNATTPPSSAASTSHAYSLFPSPKFHTLLAGRLEINKERRLLDNGALDQLVPSLAHLTNLRRLSLYANDHLGGKSVNGAVWRLLRRIRGSLKALDLSRTNVQERNLAGLVEVREDFVTPDSIEEPWQCTRNEVLEDLDISFTAVNDDVSRRWMG